MRSTTPWWSVLPRGQRLGLRGYDALRRASTEQLSDDEPVAVAGERSLLNAWHQLGLATLDTGASDP